MENIILNSARDWKQKFNTQNEEEELPLTPIIQSVTWSNQISVLRYKSSD